MAEPALTIERVEEIVAEVREGSNHWIIPPTGVTEPAEVVWSRPDCLTLARLFGWGARVFILRDRLAVAR